MTEATTQPTTPPTTTGTIDFQLQTAVPGGEAVLVNDGPCNDQGPVRLVMPHALWVELGNPNELKVTLETKCDGCGCTDSEACLGGCSWAAPAICSNCV